MATFQASATLNAQSFGKVNWEILRGDNLSTLPPNTATIDGSISVSPDTGTVVSYVVDGNTVVSNYNYVERNTPLTFTATFTMPRERTAVEWIWDFGDGVKGYGNPVIHEYVTPILGARVSLRILDDLGRPHYIYYPVYITDTLALYPSSTTYPSVSTYPAS